MINERASDRINFLSFYVSLALGSTCSLAATRYLEICHWSWPSASARLRAPASGHAQGCFTVCNGSRNNWECQGLGQKSHWTWPLSPCDHVEYHKKAHVKCAISALLLVVCTHTHLPLLTTAARLLTPWGWRSN